MHDESRTERQEHQRQNGYEPLRLSLSETRQSNYETCVLHEPCTAAALAEAFRLLRPGGRLAFTDWTVHRPLSSEEADIMWRGIAAQSLQSSDSYRNLIRTVGFASAVP